MIQTDSNWSSSKDFNPPPPLIRPSFPSEMELRLMYTMAIIRFVNGMADSIRSLHNSKDSVASLAIRIGLPIWFVDMRHTGTHGPLPSLALLQSGAHHALNWLKEFYWDVEYVNINSHHRTHTVSQSQSTHHEEGCTTTTITASTDTTSIFNASTATVIDSNYIQTSSHVHDSLPSFSSHPDSDSTFKILPIGQTPPTVLNLPLFYDDPQEMRKFQPDFQATIIPPSYSNPFIIQPFHGQISSFDIVYGIVEKSNNEGGLGENVAQEDENFGEEYSLLNDIMDQEDANDLESNFSESSHERCSNSGHDDDLIMTF